MAVCDECDGSGEVLDAPQNVLDGRSYVEACPKCSGSGRTIVTVGDDFPKQQARVREVLGHYKEIGPAGAFGAAMIEDLLRRADEAAISQDIVAIVRTYQEMRNVQE